MVRVYLALLALLLLPVAAAVGSPAESLFYNPANPSGDGTPPTVGAATPAEIRDLVGTNHGTLRNGAHYVGAGTTANPYAIRFDGVDDYVSTAKEYGHLDSFSISAWFRTTDADGLIVGFSGSQTGLTAHSWDRILYLDAGNVRFGTWTGYANTIVSPKSYNDGAWHFATVTMGLTGSSDGMKLYVDGELVASSTNTQKATYNGWWRVGAGMTWHAGNGGGWGVDALAGDIGTVQIDSGVLTAEQVETLYQSGQGPAQPVPEMPTLAMMAVGLVAVVLVARRRA